MSLASRVAGGLLALCAVACAQTTCQPTPAYSPCDLVFDLNDAEMKAHPNPYLTVQLQAEFRSPRHRTLLMPGFWDGGRRMVIRFAPTESGSWDFRVTSSLERFEGQLGKVEATESPSPGFVMATNVHHWAYSEARKPHLWMGDTFLPFATADRALFDQYVETRASQKFNHVRGLLLGGAGGEKLAFSAPDRPNPEYFRQIDERIVALNKKGICVDLTLIGDRQQVAALLPAYEERERFVRYVVARYAPMHVTWQLAEEFERLDDPRATLKQIGETLKRLDPYKHPRSTHTVDTSASALSDGWMDHIVYHSPEDAVGAVEHQLYPYPQVNEGFVREDSGAGREANRDADSDAFRRALWNAAMNGQYPTFANTGVAGGHKIAPDAKYLDSPGARAMTVWFEFFDRCRHWELEPYFDVDGGRAIALPDVEYIVYVEKPSGPVELLVEKHGYDVEWINPINGESQKQKKDFKGDKFVAEPPDKTHDWVLHVSREGRKEGMLRSYKFDSRPIVMQEVEVIAQKAPFEIIEPPGDTLSLAKPPKYQAKLKRETRATRSMMYLWTADAPAEGMGYRVVGTGPEGTFRFPPNSAKKFPAVLTVRVGALNANGKVYIIDKVYRLTQ